MLCASQMCNDRCHEIHTLDSIVKITLWGFTVFIFRIVASLRPMLAFERRMKMSYETTYGHPLLLSLCRIRG